MGKGKKQWQPRRSGDLASLLLPLIALSDFEKLPKEKADQVYQSMPPYFRRTHESADRELLGIYEIAGDSKAHMYFIHSFNHDDDACSCALLVDFRNDERMPIGGRKWMCLNPRSPEVAIALDLCSSLVHADDDEDHNVHDVVYV